MILLPKSLGSKLYLLEQKIVGNQEAFQYLKWLNATQYYTPRDIYKLQWEKLRKLLSYSYRTIPFYQKLFDTYKINVKKIASYNDFLNIPILDKTIIRIHSREMISNEFRKETLIKNHSSGSTGRPLTFYQTKDFTLKAKAHQLRNYGWCGYEIGDRFALLWGSEIYFRLKTIRDKFENFLINRIELNTSKLTEEILREFAITLNKLSPQLISTYPSSIYFTGRIIEKYNLPDIKVGAIQTTSEVLTKFQRNYIGKIFHSDIYDKYGSRETNVISHECPKHQGMHINAENVFVEFLKNGRPVKNGQLGEVVITSLNNYGMPFIRYRMGDLASPLQGSCTCGIKLPRMGKLIGRKSDMIVTTDGGMVDPYLFSYILMQFQEIDTFQVIQETLNQIKIRLKLRDLTRKNFEDRVTQLIYKFSDPRFKIVFEYLDDMLVGQAGKHRATISKVDYTW